MFKSQSNDEITMRGIGLGLQHPGLAMNVNLNHNLGQERRKRLCKTRSSISKSGKILKTCIGEDFRLSSEDQRECGSKRKIHPNVEATHR
jgi:hypothetical protein